MLGSAAARRNAACFRYWVDGFFVKTMGEILGKIKFYHFHETGKTSSIKQTNRLHDNTYLREDGSNLAAYLYYLQVKCLCIQFFLRLLQVYF